MSFNTTITDKLHALTDSLLNGHYIFSQSFDESYLANRFSKPTKYVHNVSFGVTTDIEKINSYYSIRELAYRNLLNDETFGGGEDAYDLDSNIFIAESGNNCIGGVRITVSRPGQELKLPLEADGFDLKQAFSHIGLENIVYGEPSKLAILPDYRDGQVLDKLQMDSALYYTKELGVEIAFGRSHAVQTRRFKKLFNNMGYQFIARLDIRLPYKDYDTHLWAIDFTPDQRYTDMLKGKKGADFISQIGSELEFA